MEEGKKIKKDINLLMIINLLVYSLLFILINFIIRNDLLNKEVIFSNLKIYIVPILIASIFACLVISSFILNNKFHNEYLMFKEIAAIDFILRVIIMIISFILLKKGFNEVILVIPVGFLFNWIIEINIRRQAKNLKFQ